MTDKKQEPPELAAERERFARRRRVVAWSLCVFLVAVVATAVVIMLVNR